MESSDNISFYVINYYNKKSSLVNIDAIYLMICIFSMFFQSQVMTHFLCFVLALVVVIYVIA